MSSRLPTRELRRSDSSSIVARNSRVSAGVHWHVVLQQARDRRLDAGERRAQIVGDGGEDRRAQVARRGESPRLGGLRLELLERERRRDLAGEGVEDAAVCLSLDLPPDDDQHVDVVQLDPPSLGAVGHGSAGGVVDRPPPLDVVEDDDSVEPEDPAEPFEQGRHRRCAGEARRVPRLLRGPGRRPRRAGQRGRRTCSRPRPQRERPNSASRFSPSAIVNVWNGGVKYQLTRRNPATAAASAGQTPPTAEIATTRRRKSRRMLGRPRWVRRFVSTQVKSGSETAASRKPEANPSPGKRAGPSRPRGRRARSRRPHG